MNNQRSEVEIIRIGRAEYDQFASLLEWRRTGVDGTQNDRYQAPELRAFMVKYGILESESYFIYAARVSGKMVGYINVVLIPKPDPRLGILYIDELWTAPPFRGHDIAGQLLQKTLQLAKEMDLWRVRLYVNTDNDSARACYRKAGFAEKEDCLFCEADVAK